MNILRIASICTLALLLLPISALSTAERSGTLLYNINGYTLSDEGLIQFDALEFNQGRVTRLFKDQPEALASARNQAGQTIDGGGTTLLPGLIDAHGHVSSHGRALEAVDLVGIGSEADSALQVAEFIQRKDPGDWVLGRGWNQVLWSNNEFPDRQSLDQLDTDAAIALNRIDGHAVWVNSRALELANIDDHTPDPAGGQIIRDDRGRATGVLIDNAMDMVFAQIPAESVQQNEHYVLAALRDLAEVGLTSVHDAGSSSRDIQAMQNLRGRDQLPVRIYAMLDVLNSGNDVYLNQGIHLDDQQMLEIRSVKISADGALGSRGAALAADYSDLPGHQGLLLLSDEELQRQMSRSMAMGYQVNVHAIGDLANTGVLNLFEQLQADTLRLHQRHRVEHAQILDPADLNRFQSLSVIASIQPTHATSDKNMAGDRLGPQRLKGAYAWRTLIDSGAAVAGGSDFPVEPTNPFFGLHAAVTRQDREDQPEDGWLPEEKTTREQALALFTQGAAYAAHQEQSLGQLTPGYWADFILISDDYFEVAAQDIWKIQVLETWVAGKQVFKHSN